MPGEGRADWPASEVNFDEAAKWLTFVHDRVLVALNWGEQAQRVPIPGGEWKLAMRSDSSSDSAAALALDESLQVDAVPPGTTCIFIGA